MKKMSRYIFFCLVSFVSINKSFTQQVGIGTNSPSSSAMLDVSSINKGLLVPRMLSSQRTDIPAPANGLIVYDLDSSSLFIYQPTGWKKIKALTNLNDLIAGNANGDVLLWNGSQWIATPKSNLFAYVYRDEDGDGHGDKYRPVAGVLPFPGFVADSIDCNDANPLAYNGAVEICGDGVDNNCNGLIDEVPTGGPDLPDDFFIDANCDGIDGTEADAIFVAATGNNANPGTKAQPVATIAAGISKAIAQGKTQVYVAMGTYSQKVTLSNGISLYGGYNAAASWARSASNTTTILFAANAMEGSSITSSTMVDRFTIQAGNATGTDFGVGRSSYGVYCSGCTALTIKNCNIIAGNGAAGLAGSNGAAGANGNPGVNGTAGSCNTTVTASGGGGGSSSCVRAGGNGGSGGHAANGAAGINGVGATGGFGTGGSAGIRSGGVTQSTGGDGGNGTDGINGANGGGGLGGNGGTFLSGLWSSNGGSTGSVGTNGGGGGGGGGGGSDGCSACVEGTGNGGGGGGSGGCAAVAFGGGGYGGGGSFGIFLVNSTGIQLIANTITSGNAGNGGSGGNGFTGGIGGIGGTGATICTTEVGQGGNGGDGGSGGASGGGGGGAGGPSYSLARYSTTVTTTGNTLAFGTGGTGGSGGASPVNTGGNGSNGGANTILVIP